MYKARTPVQIHIGGDTGIPEKFWEHVRKTLVPDGYPVVTLYDDGNDLSAAAEKGINHQYHSYIETEGVRPQDMLKARRWVKEFPTRFGDELDLLAE